MRARLRSQALRSYIVLIVVFFVISINIIWLSQQVYQSKKDLKAERTETVIKDDLGIIMPYELNAVRRQGTRFELYSIALYIGNDINYRHFNEKLAKKLLPEKNCILITIEIQDEEVTKMGYYYNIETDVSAEKIVSSFFKYSMGYGKDKGWLTNAFREIVSYLKKAENKQLEKYIPALRYLYIIELMRITWVGGSLFLIYYMLKRAENTPDLLSA